MTAKQYERLSAPFRARPQRAKALRLTNQLLTRTCYLLYPLLLAGLLLQQDARLIRAILCPAIAFVVLSLFRRAVNLPRPYEVLDFQPLIHKDTHGNSFPSRHVFSIFLIAVTWFWVVPWAGVVLGGMGVLLAVIRVIGGVHFPRDVIAGALCGIAAGCIGFWLV